MALMEERIKIEQGCKDTYVVGGISNAEYRVAGCVFNGCYQNTIVVGLTRKPKTGMGMGDIKEDVQRMFFADKTATIMKK